MKTEEKKKIKQVNRGIVNVNSWRKTRERIRETEGAGEEEGGRQKSSLFAAHKN